MNLRVERQAIGNNSKFECYVDNLLFCYTYNDDDGMKLMIAIAKLKLLKEY